MAYKLRRDTDSEREGLILILGQRTLINQIPTDMLESSILELLRQESPRDWRSFSASGVILLDG